MEDPLWQGARENVERILATIDWGEQIIATKIGVIYEYFVRKRTVSFREL